MADPLELRYADILGESSMRVLHITNWYPHAQDPLGCLFVKRHIDALRISGEHDVWQVCVRHTRRWGWRSKPLHADREFRLDGPFRSYWLIEQLSFLLLLWAWITRDRSRTYDLVNIVIAYPNATRITLLRRLFGVPVTLTEHWTAYHFSFRATGRGLDRIRNIFRHGVPVVVVSRSLAADIERFSGGHEIPFHIVDNVVDERFSHTASAMMEPGRFFAIGGLRPPKRMDVLLEAIARARAAGFPASLRIAGIGEQLHALRAQAHALGIADHVAFLGEVDAQHVATELRAAHALLHASEHETYSVVCAEALCCGTPVVASAVGPVPTFVNTGNGALVDSNAAELWAHTITTEWDRLLAIDRASIATTMRERTSAVNVGRAFNGILRSIVERSASRAR